MPSTVYKGDIAEVSFAPETGLFIECATDADFTLAHGEDHTTITFSGQANADLFHTNQKLKFPNGMLVGSQVIFADSGASTNPLDTKDLDGVFTIVFNEGEELKVSPVMASTAQLYNESDTISLQILPYKTPPINKAMTPETANSESVLTDQFLGITNALTLPETKIDLKRFHVVGLGRDTSGTSTG